MLQLFLKGSEHCQMVKWQASCLEQMQHHPAVVSRLAVVTAKAGLAGSLAEPAIARPPRSAALRRLDNKPNVQH